jgi:hypothetical protein
MLDFGKTIPFILVQIRMCVEFEGNEGFSFGSEMLVALSGSFFCNNWTETLYRIDFPFGFGLKI